MLLHRSLVTFVAASLTLSAASAGTLQGMNVARRGQVHAAPPPPASVSYSAVVGANGALKRGNGATGAMQADGKGTYEVDFVADVSGCAYVATLGETGSTGQIPPGFITVVGRSGVPEGVYVATYDITGSLAKLPFHIDVGC
jgi:hypothetical protein